MSPYRERGERPLGPRWGATRWVRAAVWCRRLQVPGGLTWLSVAVLAVLMAMVIITHVYLWGTASAVASVCATIIGSFFIPMDRETRR